MQIEYVIGGENFMLESIEDASVGMIFINFMHLDNTTARWVNTNAGSQYSKKSELQHGGQMGYIQYLLDSINKWLSDHFGGSVPTSDIEIMMQAIKDRVVVSDNKLSL